MAARGRCLSALVCLLATLGTACRDDGPGPKKLTDVTEYFAIEPWSSEALEATSLKFLPDGRALVITKGGWFGEGTGVLKLLDRDGTFVRDLLEVPVCTDAERGLLGLEYGPGAAGRPSVYLFYTRQMEDCTVTHRTEPLVRPVWNRVARWVFDDTGMDYDDLEVVIDELPGHVSAHNAGDLEFLADGSLLVSAGEAGLGPSGQIPIDVPNGKVLRIDPAAPGRPLIDNPLYRDGMSGFREFVFASGFRNPFRLAVRESDGLIVTGDVGTDDIEELNVVRAGERYGYPAVEGPGGEGFVDPVDFYHHSSGCATIIVGEFAPGALIPLVGVDDDVLVYLDFVCGRIWAAEFVVGALGFPTMSRRWLLGTSPGPQMSDLAIGPDGAVYLVAIGPGPFPIYRMSRTK